MTIVIRVNNYCVLMNIIILIPIIIISMLVIVILMIIIVVGMNNYCTLTQVPSSL